MTYVGYTTGERVCIPFIKAQHGYFCLLKIFIRHKMLEQES